MCSQRTVQLDAYNPAMMETVRAELAFDELRRSFGRLRVLRGVSVLFMPACNCASQSGSNANVASAAGISEKISRVGVSQIRAGRITCPSNPLTGLTLMIAGCASIGPNRNLGPPRSIRMRQDKPVARSALRRVSIMRDQISG